jgi:hypothetical protein
VYESKETRNWDGDSFYFTSCITLCKFPIESIKCNKAFLTKSRAKTVVVEEKKYYFNKNVNHTFFMKGNIFILIQK